MGANVLDPSPGNLKMMFAKLPGQNGILPPSSSPSDVAKISLSQKTLNAENVVASRKGATTSSCVYFKICGTYSGAEVDRVASIISDPSTATAVKNNSAKRIQDLIWCFTNSGHCNRVEAISIAFTPAVGLPLGSLLNGLTPEVSNNLIYYKTNIPGDSYSQFKPDGSQEVVVTYRTIFTDQYGNIVNTAMPTINLTNFWSVFTNPPPPSWP